MTFRMCYEKVFDWNIACGGPVVAISSISSSELMEDVILTVCDGPGYEDVILDTL